MIEFLKETIGSALALVLACMVIMLGSLAMTLGFLIIFNYVLLGFKWMMGA